ncbi:MAG: XRE family transcriptional regulator, partial [Lachnospiraceae bacterium]|nr:XRE family transcriptional regulator [Lachnospiraceae bacterium]
FREIRFPFMHRAEYWTGWVIAYYQWSRGTSFKEIDKEIPIETIADMYLSYNERDITIIVDHINELIHNKA